MSIFEEELKRVKERGELLEKADTYANYSSNAFLYLRSKFPEIEDYKLMEASAYLTHMAAIVIFDEINKSTKNNKPYNNYRRTNNAHRV